MTKKIIRFDPDLVSDEVVGFPSRLGPEGQFSPRCKVVLGHHRLVEAPAHAQLQLLVHQALVAAGLLVGLQVDLLQMLRRAAERLIWIRYNVTRPDSR